MAVPDVYRALWRRKFMIIVFTAVIVVGAYYLTKRQQRIYTASTLVRVQQKVQNTGEAFLALQTGGRLAQTYATIAASNAIATGIYKDLKKTVPWGEIAGHISGSQVQDLELLRISASSPVPARAQLIANTAPEALDEFIKKTGTLRESVIVVDPAGRPAFPSSPNVRLNVMIALMLGLVFNGGLALLLEIVGDRVRSGEELERIVGKPVLAFLPEVSLIRPGRGNDLPEEPIAGESLDPIKALHG